MTMRDKPGGQLGRFMGFFSPMPASGDARREAFLDVARRGRLAHRMAAGEGAFLLSMEIPGFFAFLSLYGEDIAQYVSRQAQEELGRVAAAAVPRRSRLDVEQVDCGRFIVLIGCEVPAPEDRLRLCLNLRLAMKQWLRRTTMRLTRQALEIRVGSAVLSPGRDFEVALYDAACAAQDAAPGLLNDPALGLAREFREIVEQGLVEVLYQPIADLGTGRVIGWEALTRGPRDSYFHTPTALFDYAEQTGGVFQLERLYRERAIRGVVGMEPGQKVFMNLHLDTLLDPEFTSGETLRVLEGTGLTPANVVFEVTERHAIRDFPLFRTTIGHYRSQGFGVAVDDVGAGYSGLWSMAEFTPDFIKLDFSLTREIDTHPVKRGLIKTFLAFAESFGCELIAKGIERDTELTSLISMGVHHGEGYYLGRPGNPRPGLSLRWPEWSGAAPTGGRPRPGASCNIPIRSLAETELKKVAPTTPVSEVKRIIGEESSISAVVVVEGNVPVGLIMSHHMDRALSSQYGMSLYYKRGVSEIMDRRPLVVDEAAPVEQVARQAMARDRGRIYDHIVVTRNREVTGLVSVQKMLDTLAAVQVEMAKGANPLTGLPGNVAIEQEVERRCASPEGWVSIVYADLDNFKVYNDVYGFKNGDDVIKLTAEVLRWASARHGAPDDFVGHVGGDDFILITRSERAERICRAVTRVFGRCIRRHYTPEDRERCGIIGKDRATGEEREFPLVAVSLAIVDCEGGRCDMDAISRRSAEMKKVAKRRAGNVWVRDRRGAPAHLLAAEDEVPACHPCGVG